MTRRALAAGLLAACAAGPAAAQIGGAGVGIGGPGRLGLPALSDGQSLGAVEVAVRGPAVPGLDRDALTELARRAFGLSAGGIFNPLLAEAGLARVRALPGVRDAGYTLSLDAATQALVLRLRVVPGNGPGARQGMAAGGGLGGFPVIWQDDRSLLRVLANGGLGVFSDGDPWFGRPLNFTRRNPLVADPPAGAGTGPRATWFETYVEYGLAGATRLGDSPFYAYGAVTGLTALSAGRDIFRDNTRTTTTVEKLYAGLIYAPLDGDLRVNASVGRQNFTLNDGFLVSQYGMQWNAGPRPGVYLAPRTTTDMSGLLTVRYGRWVFTGFYLDPNEYEPIESNTKLLGGNLRFNITDRFRVDATMMYVPSSDTRYALPDGRREGRQGLRVYAGHARWADPAVLDGLWLESEVAHEDNANFAMSAWAGYATLGYLARTLPWSPSLSYRYAAFSGDDPTTGRYDRFDALYSGGLNEWLQGISITKASPNANRGTHRIRLNVAPKPGTTVTFDLFLHRAESLTNLGGNPALATLISHDLGQEYQVTLRAPIGDRLYFLGVAGVAVPGTAIRAAAGGTAHDWTTLQAQLFWNF